MKRLDQILAVDVESTCWQGEPPAGQEAEIIEIGVCTLDVALAQPLGKYSLLVRPEHSTVGSFCTELTTLTQEQADGGLSFAEACQRLRDRFLSMERVWASFGVYDRWMLEQQCRARGVVYPFGSTHHNVKNLIAVAHAWPEEIDLAETLGRLNLDFEGTEHRGVDDAWNVARVLAHVMQRCRK